jgi:hypothetical protein
LKLAAAVGWFLVRLLTAFTIAWFGSGVTCWVSRALGARLADLTCGHNVMLPFLAIFIVAWPLLELGGPLIWYSMRRKKKTGASKVV